jgi:hypothetical protein
MGRGEMLAMPDKLPPEILQTVLPGNYSLLQKKYWQRWCQLQLPWPHWLKLHPPLFSSGLEVKLHPSAMNDITLLVSCMVL